MRKGVAVEFLMRDNSRITVRINGTIQYVGADGVTGKILPGKRSYEDSLRWIQYVSDWRGEIVRAHGRLNPDAARNLGKSLRVDGDVGSVAGAHYVQASAKGKRTTCGIRAESDITLCGISRDALTDVTGDTWQAIRDDEVMGEGYRPCANCAAAYAALPVRNGKVTMTDRLPLHVAPDGSTPRDAEIRERVWAHLGKVVPDLVANDENLIADECVWTVGAKVTHAGVKRGKVVFLVCREIPEYKAKHPDKPQSVKCGTCRKLLYRVPPGEKRAVLSSAMVRVMMRSADDPDRYRPVGGVGKVSPDQATRPVSDELLNAARADSAQMFRGAGVRDGGRVTAGYREYEGPGYVMALQGWAAERMGSVVRDSSGRVMYKTGWLCARETGKVPADIWRAMSRTEKTACVKGMAYVRELNRASLRKRRERARTAEPAAAVAVYRDAVREGADRRPQKGRPSNPYPRPGGVWAEFRDAKRD